MKANLYQKLSLLLFLLCCAATAQAQQYYAVVGAFRKESNAIKFTGFVKSRFFQATYELHPERKLYYVYALKSTNKKEVITQVKNLQQDKLFSDAWFFKGQLGIAAQPEPAKPQPIEPVADPVTVKSDATLLQPIDTIAVDVPEEVPSDTTDIDPAAVKPEPIAPLKAKGKFLKFVITNPSGANVAGVVHHVDLKVGRDIATYPSNEYSDVPRPTDRVDPMAVVCGIFGYKEITQFVDYTNPAATEGATVDENGVWSIPFTLERLKKGDISVMYDVAFYKDAVIMLPRAQQELDELLNMMTSNPNYEIEVHGHCNGKEKRKIIMLGKNRNYFDISGSEEKNGSAKELSKLRAEAVRDYLVERGIDKKRIKIMEWGATNMLVKQNSPSARLNDRIEIEILKD
jgi:outer membrane protein OmpA-like peptidoglycan-associated protein